MRSLQFTSTDEPESYSPFPAEIYIEGTTDKWNFTSAGDQIPVKSNPSKQVWMLDFSDTGVVKFYQTNFAGKNLYVSYMVNDGQITLQTEDQEQCQRNFVITYNGGHMFQLASEPTKYLSTEGGALVIADSPTRWSFGHARPELLPDGMSSTIPPKEVTIRDADISSMYWENKKLASDLRVKVGENADRWQIKHDSNGGVMIQIPGYAMHASVLGDNVVVAGANGPNPYFIMEHRKSDPLHTVILKYEQEELYIYVSYDNFLKLTSEIAQATPFLIQVAYATH